jgi:hypothetical protein
MKKFLVAATFLALTSGGILTAGAAAEKAPISYFGGQDQALVDENRLNAYHDELVKYYQNSTGLRHDIWEKIHLFASQLADPETAKEEVVATQQDIQELNNELEREELSFRWDLNSRFPDLATDKYRGCLGAATGTRGPGR